MNKRDIVNETIEKIQAALDEYDGLRESRKEFMTIDEWFEEKRAETKILRVSPDRKDLSILRESPEEFPKPEEPMDWLKEGTTTLTHESPINKEFLIKETNMETDKKQSVSTELNIIFEEQLKRLEQIKNVLETKIRIFSGESSNKVDGLKNLDEELIQDNYISNTRDNLQRLESLNNDFVELVNIIDEYI